MFVVLYHKIYLVLLKWTHCDDSIFVSARERSVYCTFPMPTLGVRLLWETILFSLDWDKYHICVDILQFWRLHALIVQRVRIQAHAPMACVADCVAKHPYILPVHGWSTPTARSARRSLLLWVQALSICAPPADEGASPEGQICAIDLATSFDDLRFFHARFDGLRFFSRE